MTHLDLVNVSTEQLSAMLSDAVTFGDEERADVILGVLRFREPVPRWNGILVADANGFSYPEGTF